MAKLLFLIIVFIVAIAFSFYFSAEGFTNAVAGSDVATPVQYVEGISTVPPASCPPGSTLRGIACYDKNDVRVEPICSANDIKMRVNGEWECKPRCPDGSSRNPADSGLLATMCSYPCPAGKTKVDQQCVPSGATFRPRVPAICPTGTTLDPRQGCVSSTPGVAPVAPSVCPSGYSFNSNLGCVGSCPSGTVANSAGNLCIRPTPAPVAPVATAMTPALQAELTELNKTMTYLTGLGITEKSANVTYDNTAKRLKEINAIANPAAHAAANTPTALLTAELAKLNETMRYLTGLGINANSQNVTYNNTAKRIAEINAILNPGSATAPAAAPVVAAPAPAPAPVPVPPTIPLVTPSGVQVPTPAPGMTVDNSGNVISNRLKDLISILTQSNLNLNGPDPNTSNVTQPAPVNNNTSGSNANSLSQFYDTLKPQIKKDITDAVNNGFERSTVLPSGGKRCASPAVQQGIDWSQSFCEDNNQQDMSEYIRKDSVPCWGCSGL
jgi:hypothetical protein